MIFQYIPNPKSIKMQQQPDAPEPGNRVQTAVDLLTNPLIPDMLNRRGLAQSFWFSNPGEIMHALEHTHLQQLFGDAVTNPPQPRPPQGGQLGTFWQEQDTNKKKKKK